MEQSNLLIFSKMVVTFTRIAAVGTVRCLCDANQTIQKCKYGC